MTRLTRSFARLSAALSHLLFRARDEERALAEELQEHLAERIDALTEQGMPPDEAQWQAQRELGNVLLIKERGREVWRWAFVDELSADVRYALRQLRRSPSFALATILTLALGIGANTVVFSLINAVFLRPLPFSEPDRLVDVRSFDRRSGGHPTNLSYPTFFDFRRDNRVFDSIVCYRDEGFTITGRGQPFHVSGEIVSADLFSLLRVKPELGRGFLPSEEARGQHVVILSHALWQSHFGADQSVVGSTITVDGQPTTVVGIAPRGFNFPIRGRQVELWTTLAVDAGAATFTPMTEQRGSRILDAIARLAPGESAASAQAQLDTIGAALAAAYPDDNANVARSVIVPELDRLAGPAREPMLILFGAVALVLLIACANVANMLLARTADREHEFGIRLAIGGSRARVIRQLLTENLCLSVLGSVVGVTVAMLAIQFALPILKFIPRSADAAEIDGRVLAFSVGLVLMTSLLVSITPALRIARMDGDGSLRGRTRGSTDEHDRVRGLLVVAQIAIGLVLTSGASLLAADFFKVINKDLGFRPDHLLTFNISLSDVTYRAEARMDFVNRLIEHLQHTPGVVSAAAAMPLPLMGDEMTISFDIEERPKPMPERPRSDIAIVTPDYFHTIGTTLLDGRMFTDHDDDDAPPVVMVNQAFADRFFPGERAVGKRIQPGARSHRGVLMREIVGVVGNARQSALGPRPEPIYYLPFKQMPWGPPSLVLRTQVPPLSLEPTVRDVVMGLDKEVPISDTDTLDALLAANLAGSRFVLILMGSFAAMALVLTAVGLYGVLAYAVLRRTREIGVRIALGATRGGILTMMLRRAMRLVLFGVPIGIGGALLAGQLLTRVISEPQLSNPLPLLTLTCVIVSLTAAAAAYLPARRAATIDPTRALRAE
jgi:putative ABC transport system permease protein